MTRLVVILGVAVAAAVVLAVVLAALATRADARDDGYTPYAKPDIPPPPPPPPPPELPPPPLSAAAVKARGALEHLEYRQRTCSNLRRMYEPVIVAGSCDAGVVANLPESVPAAARPGVALALAARCREFPSVRDLAYAIDECRDD
jgi:hypothetical protein